MARANVTLSLPAPLVRRARHYAVDHDTSLSALVAECLEERIGPGGDGYLAARDRAIDRMKRASSLGPMQPLDRDDAHER